MAIQVAWEDEFGNTYANAYARVEEVNCNFLNAVESGRFIVKIYKNKTAMQNNKRPVDVIGYDFQKHAVLNDDGTVYRPAFDDVLGQKLYDASQTDPRKLCYVWLKTIPPYNGGIDV